MLSLPVKTTALVLIDLQKGILGMPLAPHAIDQVLAHSVSLVTAFRAKGGTVVLVHVGFGPDGLGFPKGEVDSPSAMKTPPGPDWSEFHPSLGSAPTDLTIMKKQWGAFHGSELDSQLRRRGVTTIVLGGVATNIGVEQTAREAWQYNYSVVLAEDATSTMSAEMHTFAIEKIFPRISRIRKTSEILAALS